MEKSRKACGLPSTLNAPPYRVELLPRWHQVLRRADNQAEVLLATRSLVGVTRLLGARHSEAELEACVRQAVGSPDFRWLHSIEVGVLHLRGAPAPDAEQGLDFSLDFARAIPTHSLPRANTPKRIANRTIELSSPPPGRTSASWSRGSTSPRTLSRPRSMNWRNPITDLMIPNTGSGVCLRRA